MTPATCPACGSRRLLGRGVESDSRGVHPALVHRERGPREDPRLLTESRVASAAVGRPSLDRHGGPSPRLKGVRILPSQAQGLGRLAKERGTTVSAVVREAIDVYLADEDEAEQFAAPTP